MKLIVIYWRDIPSQIVLQNGRQRQKAMLGARFQEAIDRAAMRAGKGSSDAYIAEWRRKITNVGLHGDAAAVINAERLRLENRFTDEDLQSLIRNNGRSGSGPPCTG